MRSCLRKGRCTGVSVRVVARVLSDPAANCRGSAAAWLKRIGVHASSSQTKPSFAEGQDPKR